MSPSKDVKHSPFSSNKLAEVILNKDIDALRGYFDDAFWAGNREKPTWEHLKLALLKKDKPKMRVLITWGAFPTNKDMEELKTVSGKEYPGYVSMLRQCGLRLSPYALELLEKQARSLAEEAVTEEITKTFVNGKYVDHRLAAIPEEWLTVLDSIQKEGAVEGIIAGGALRDLYNERPVKDVDIFVVSRGSAKKNEKFLREIVKKNGFEVMKKEAASGDGPFASSHTVEDFSQKTSSGVNNSVVAESWTFTMEQSGQEYNVIFVGDPIVDVEDYLNNGAPVSPTEIKNKVLEHFDFGICQIACDGEEISTTAAYKSDVKNKMITKTRPDTDKEHLERIMAKYPDWKLCSESKKLIEPPPAPVVEKPKPAKAPPKPVAEEGTCSCGKPISQSCMAPPKP